MARANFSEPTQVIQPGTSVPIRLEMRQACELNPRHEQSFTAADLAQTSKVTDMTQSRQQSGHKSSMALVERRFGALAIPG